TTKVSPMEALRGQTGTPFDSNRSQEEVAKYLESLHQNILISTKKVAKKMIMLHQKKTKFITFNIGDTVLCKDPERKISRKKFDEAIYKYKAIVISVGRSTNYKYKLQWCETGGPNKEDKPGSIAKRYWSSKNMKLLTPTHTTEIRTRTRKRIKKRRVASNQLNVNSNTCNTIKEPSNNSVNSQETSKPNDSNSGLCKKILILYRRKNQINF